MQEYFTRMLKLAFAVFRPISRDCGQLRYDGPGPQGTIHARGSVHRL